MRFIRFAAPAVALLALTLTGAGCAGGLAYSSPTLPENLVVEAPTETRASLMNRAREHDGRHYLGRPDAVADVGEDPVDVARARPTWTPAPPPPPGPLSTLPPR